MNENKFREQICVLATSIFDRGLTHGSTGNISVRLDDNNILKYENDLELIIDAKRNEIQFIQCNSNREKFRKILKVKSLDLFNNFKDAWFGLVARNVSFDDAILMCSSSKTENVITEKDFNFILQIILAV